MMTPDQTNNLSQNTPPHREGRVCVYGIEFDHITGAETIAEVFTRMEAGQGGQLLTANLDHLLRATREPKYLKLVSRAELNVADGMPIVWASKLRGRALPERVAGSDLVHGLVRQACEKGRSVYLLGGNPGVAEQAAEIWCEQYPELKIAGTHCPPMGFEKNPESMVRVREAVESAHPDLVLVALGSPKQEYLIENLRDLLPLTWWVGIGISFSFVTGEVRRAPVWMQKIGFEWLFRLICEPRRLARRYLLDGLPFVCVLLISAIGARLGMNRLFDRPRCV